MKAGGLFWAAWAVWALLKPVESRVCCGLVVIYLCSVVWHPAPWWIKALSYMNFSILCYLPEQWQSFLCYVFVLFQFIGWFYAMYRDRSDLYDIEEPELGTYAQMALWHAEDEKWLKARAAEAAAAERHYNSVEASTERLMAQKREIARLKGVLAQKRWRKMAQMAQIPHLAQKEAYKETGGWSRVDGKWKQVSPTVDPAHRERMLVPVGMFKK